VNLGFGLNNLTSITVSELTKAGAGSALVLLIAGIALLFAGRLILKLTVSVGFGVLLAYIGLRVSSVMKLGQIASILVVLILFVIGFLVGWVIFKLSLSIIAGLSTALLLGGYMSLNLLYTLLLAIILMVIFYLAMEYIITAVAALAGLALIYISVNSLAGGEWALVAVILMLVLAIIVKTAHRRRK